MSEDVARPRVFERECGGWMAVTDTDAYPRIGVTADTEDAVRAKYETARQEWLELLTRAEPQ